MAAGFPVKQNYAAGDILTAAQMNDLSSTLNYLDPTAKGDLFPASSGTALTRLAVGNNGETLVADSSTSTGLRYQAAKSFNYVINGGMDISQRGTSFVPTSGLYTLDRWYGQRYGTANGTVSQVNTSDTTNLPQITKAMRIASNSGSTASGTIISSPFENAQTQQLIGQTVTFSFYIRKGANYSGTACTGILAGGTGTDQSLDSGFTGQTTLLTVNPTLTTTWQRVQGTVTIGSTYTQLGIYFTTGGTGTAGANDWVEITGVQLELGSIATPFQRSGGTIQGELAACQRYYFRRSGTTNNMVANSAVAYSSTFSMAYIQPPVVMRTAPSSMDISNVSYVQYDEATTSLSSYILNGSRSTESQIYIYASGTGMTAGRFGTWAINNTTGYIGFSAEL